MLERGKNVEERAADMARIARENTVDPDSNYCFGEGGAGAVFRREAVYPQQKARAGGENPPHTRAAWRQGGDSD